MKKQDIISILSFFKAYDIKYSIDDDITIYFSYIDSDSNNIINDEIYTTLNDDILEYLQSINAVLVITN